MKKHYFTLLCLLAVSMTTVVNAQNLTKLGVRYSEDTSKKLNDVPDFNPAVTNYTVYLSSAHTIIPKVEATAEAGATNTVVQATSITGTEDQRTATVTVIGASSTKYYYVTFVVSENFIEGFTEEGNFISRFTADGTDNHGKQLGNRSCRTQNDSGGAWWEISLPNAGTLTFYLTKDNGTSNLLSTLKIKKQTSSWSTLLTYDASTYQFPDNGEWEKIEVVINEANPVVIQFEVTKTGITRDFRFDDVVVTPYGVSSDVSSAVDAKEAGVYAANGKIYINGKKSDADTGKYIIYDTNGRVVREGNYANPIAISVNKGIYVVKTNSAVTKVSVL